MVDKIGINFSAFENIQAPEINISTDPKQLLNDIPTIANEITRNYLGYGILGTMLLVFYMLLADKTPFQDFGYDDLRAFGISFGLISVIGMTLLEIGFITSWKAVSFMLVSFLAVFVYILFYENKE